MYLYTHVKWSAVSFEVRAHLDEIRNAISRLSMKNLRINS